MSQASDGDRKRRRERRGRDDVDAVRGLDPSPPSAPSRASRPMSLRPIIPAAPITRIFNGVPSLFLDPAIVGAERARSPAAITGHRRSAGSRILARIPIASACYTV